MKSKAKVKDNTYARKRVTFTVTERQEDWAKNKENLPDGFKNLSDLIRFLLSEHCDFPRADIVHGKRPKNADETP